MAKWFARAGWVMLALLITGFIALASWEPFYAEESAAPPPRQYRAEIIRDEFGVPHVYGRTDADVAFGVAIAHAEDDFFTLQDVMAMTRGRYGAITGEKGARVDYAYHLLDARGTADRHYDTLPADTRALLEAYASGLNQYAKEHAEELKLTNLFPVNGRDIAAGFALRQPFFFGLDSIIAPLVEGGELRREYGPDIPGFPRPPELRLKGNQRETANYSPLGEDAALAGSNAFAIAPAKSGGPTILVSNTHQPWKGPVAWYELVVESGEGWHFAGATFPGAPFPLLGHNENLGWTNTVNRPDLTDIYQLELNNAGTHYRLDGKWRALERRTIILPVKLGPITLPIRRTIYRSAHGPVIVNDKGAFAIRYAGIDRLDQLDAYYRLNKTRNLAEWQAQLARMAVPSTNFIYADRTGNIAYTYNAALPDRAPGHNWRGILPGNISALIWAGPVAYDKLPQYVNPASGWLYNSNNTPFTAAGPGSDLNPQDYTPELGVELKQTNRSRQAWTLLSIASRVDRAALERIKYDTAYDRAGYIADLWNMLETMDLSGETELDAARDLLLEWDFNADGYGRADALALLMIKPFMTAEYGNHVDLPDPRQELARSVAHLKSHFGRIDPPATALLRLRQGPGRHAVDLPMDGGSDTLRAATDWNVDEDGRLSVKHADSFIQWVEWAAGKPVSSRSIMPYGAATTRPGNRHYTDQAQLFVAHKLKPVHFWRKDVMANAKQRYAVESH